MAEETVASDAESPSGRPSLRVNSLARLVLEGGRLASGFVSAAITARWLGPAGKGTLSALLFIAALLSYGSTMGLGEAVTVMIGRAETNLDRSVSRSLP